MSRPTCWECGKQLMYVNGKPVFQTWTDPLGNTVKMHKDCYKYGGYENAKTMPTEIVWKNVRDK